VLLLDTCHFRRSPKVIALRQSETRPATQAAHHPYTTASVQLRIMLIPVRRLPTCARRYSIPKSTDSNNSKRTGHIQDTPDLL
jgi:hypothetical protein